MTADRKSSPPSTLAEMYEAIARIDVGVSFIKEDLLPPVASAAREARDGMLQLKEKDKVTRIRLKNLENAPPLSHTCDKEGAISANEQDIAGLSKWRWWLMSGIIGVALFAVTCGINAARDMATLQSQDAAMQNNVKRHEAEIEAIEKARAADRDKIIHEVRAVPVNVKSVIPDPDLDDVLDERPLSKRDREIIRAILDRAERRNGVKR